MKRIALLATCISILTLSSLINLSASAVQAQERGITLKSQQVINQFPDGVLFRVAAETIAPAEIKEIKLEMRVKGSSRSSYAYLKFTPATAVEGRYLLLTSGAQYKPPGTSIEYRIIISDSEQRTLETPQATHLYLDNRFEWSNVSQGLMEVYYYGPLKTRAELIIKAGAQAIDRMGALLGYQLTEPILIIAYNNPSDIMAAQPFQSRTTERELIMEGVTFPEYGTLLMIAGVDRPDGVASHEITHVIQGKLNENALVTIPSWLKEGLAEYGNVNPDQSYSTLLSRAIAERRLIPLRNMQAPPGIPEERLLMYGQGYAVVKYMIDSYGEEKFRKLFAAFNKELRIDDAMKSIYGFDQDGLDNAWRSSLGLPPVEKAEPAPVKAPAPAAEDKERQFNLAPILVIVVVAIVALLLGAILISRTRPRSGLGA